jgi:hypothetical protein
VFILMKCITFLQSLKEILNISEKLNSVICWIQQKRAQIMRWVKLVHIFIAFTDKVECNCHFLSPGSNCFHIGKLILLFFGVIFDTSGKPCSAWQ